MRKICVACEVMHEPFDEGIRIFASELSRALAVSQKRKLLLLSEKDSEIGGLRVHGALSNRYFLSRELAALIGAFAPEAVIYVSWTSLTARTLIRARALRRYAPGARIAVAALQPRRVDLIARAAAAFGRPDLVLATGPGVQLQAQRLGIHAVRVTPGVALERFSPVTLQQKALLKQRARIEPEKFVVLHVGHMKESRNIGVLEEIARLEGVACVLVASSSTVADQQIASRLSAAGVTLMTHHQDRIEFAYRLADAYLFPVTSPLDAIETPLSVLEAAACDLAIVSTPFGGLPDLLGDGVTWARTADQMLGAIRTLAASFREGKPATGTRRLVAGLGWDRLAANVLAAVEDAG